MATSHNLWPYAMRYVNDVNNTLAQKGKQESPLELFSGIKSNVLIRQFYPFGCPTYVLDGNLQ